MAQGLNDFIAAARDFRGTPFVWGVSDCTIWVADWCLIRFGFDPAADLRGSYADEAGANALVGSDLAAFVGARLGGLSVKPDADAVDGDVAVVRAFGRHVSAVRVAPFWAVKTENGVALLRAKTVKVWG